MNQHTKQFVPRIAVSPSGAGFELQRQGLRDPYDVVLRIVALIVEIVLREIRDARGVGQKIAYADRAPAGWRVWKIRRDGIVEREFAILDLQHHGHGRELLSD